MGSGKAAIAAILLPMLSWATPTLTVKPEVESITSAERVRVEVVATAAAGSKVRLPFVGSEIGGFVVRDRSEKPARLDENGEFLQASASYLLEPGLPGEYVIPELTTTLEGADVSSEAVTILVTSVLPEVTKGLAPKEALGKVGDRKWIWRGLVLFAGLLFGGLMALRRRQGVVQAEEDRGEAFAARIRTGKVGERSEVRKNLAVLVEERCGVNVKTLTAGEVAGLTDVSEGAREPLTRVLEALDHVEYGGGDACDLSEELKRLEAAL